ncbi:MerR family transcriptional regulator [Paenibacillus sedimenti]|uniref:MerR family transcriptional regulator n=1 Tax=Paenibacillus sedimenti TaxID=2770274 RepID=A0A926QM95_9BACL|nr:MerR family transcriptional regulator [Paenibacillus sedimenti]MBD0383154.1 MerR family transcriptional regulator [Paenibacillus sedimenti]
MKRLTVSQVAKASNVNIETVRYYERRGLISAPPRTHSGYRMYANEAVDDIQFIKRAQDLGFSLEEIKHLLCVYKKEDYFPIEEMSQFAAVKIQEIEEKIHQLNNFKSLLESAISRQESDLPKNQCPIIKKLSESGDL